MSQSRIEETEVVDSAGDEGTKEGGKAGTRSTSPYPYYDLEEAEAFAKGIAAAGGIEAESDDVMKEIGLASTITRAWTYRVSSAREFGLVSRGSRNDTKLRLTDLGKRIVSPASTDELRASRLAAFFEPAIYKKLFEQYRGMDVPQEIYVQGLLKRHGLLDTVVATAAEAFLKSAKFAGAIGDDRRFIRDTSSTPPRASDGITPPRSPTPPSPPTSSVQNLSVPADFILHQFQLRKDLKLAIPLPPDLTQADVRRLNKWMTTLPLEDDTDSDGAK